MGASSLSLHVEIDKILYSIANELEVFLHKLETDEKITPQDFQLFVDSLERRDHALTNRLGRAATQKLPYHIPDSLKQRLLREIFLLEHDHSTRMKVEMIMARHTAVWSVLRKIEDVIRSERYKIKVDKSEPGTSTR